MKTHEFPFRFRIITLFVLTCCSCMTGVVHAKKPGTQPPPPEPDLAPIAYRITFVDQAHQIMDVNSLGAFVGFGPNGAIWGWLDNGTPVVTELNELDGCPGELLSARGINDQGPDRGPLPG
jgi:hypothetical protein